MRRVKSGHKKSLARWTSLPDSAKPYLSEPPVWELPKHQTLAQKVEKHLPQTQNATVTPERIALPGGAALGTRKPTNMRRTVLALGFAVLVSMLFAPHGGKQGVAGWGPFFSVNGFDLTSSGIWYARVGRVMIDMLILQTIFLGVLFAVIVNIRWRRKAKKES